MANTNRTKGHDAERYYRNKFRAIGYGYCETSRYASRKHDDAKIDLVGVPFNVQIKAGYQRGMNPSKVLRSMVESVLEMFGKDSAEADKENIIIHRKQGKKGKPRTDYDDLVIMTYADFERLIKRID